MPRQFLGLDSWFEGNKEAKRALFHRDGGGAICGQMLLLLTVLFLTKLPFDYLMTSRENPALLDDQAPKTSRRCLWNVFASEFTFNRLHFLISRLGLFRVVYCGPAKCRCPD